MKKMIFLSPLLFVCLMINTYYFVSSGEQILLVSLLPLSTLYLFSGTHQFTNKQVDMSCMGKLFISLSFSGISTMTIIVGRDLLAQTELPVTVALPSFLFVCMFALTIVYFKRRYKRISVAYLKQLF